MYYGIIAIRDGGFYICEDGHKFEYDALLRAEDLVNPVKDLGVLGTVHVTTLHAQHPCPAAVPVANFLKIDPR